MLHGYQKSNPNKPLHNYLIPPPQMVKLGHPQFKPEVEVGGKSYHIEGTVKEVVGFLKQLPNDIKFVTPKSDLRKGEESSQPIRFKVSRLKEAVDENEIIRQVAKSVMNSTTRNAHGIVEIGSDIKDEIWEKIKELMSDKPSEELASTEINLEISSYLNPKEANVVTMNSDTIKAYDLGQAVGEALRVRIHRKNGQKFDQFSSATNQYNPGVESFSKPKKQENKLQNQQKQKSSRGI